MQCSMCGGSVPRHGHDIESVVCGRCVQRRCAGELLRQEAWLSRFDPAVFVELRQDHGWCQKLAAARIGVPISRLQEFERGGECPEEIADWMTARAEMP